MAGPLPAQNVLDPTVHSLDQMLALRVDRPTHVPALRIGKVTLALGVGMPAPGLILRFLINLLLLFRRPDLAQPCLQLLSGRNRSRVNM